MSRLGVRACGRRARGLVNGAPSCFGRWRNASERWSRASGVIFVVLGLLCLGDSPIRAGDAVFFDGERALGHAARMLERGQRHYGAKQRDAAIADLAAALSLHVDDVRQQRFTAREPVSGREYELTNLIGRRNPAARPRLLLGSHYDTRLWAEEDPDAARRGEPIQGANDGTSGVAVLLELLRVVSAKPALRELGIDVVLFDGEEFGRPGSRDYCKGSIHFVRNLRETYPASPPAAAIVIDMVGDRDLRIRRERSSNAPLSRWLTDEIWRHGKLAASGVFVDELDGPIIDDQSPFHAVGIPAVLVIDLDYPYWHTQRDSLDKISAQSLAAVGGTLEAALPSVLVARERASERSSPP